MLNLTEAPEKAGGLQTNGRTTPPVAPREVERAVARLALIDGREIVAEVEPNGSQTFGKWLTRHGDFLNVTAARDNEGRRYSHMAIQTRHLVWAGLDADVGDPHQRPRTAARAVEICLANGLCLRGVLPLLDGQRLSDYLHLKDSFVDLQHATIGAGEDAPPRLYFESLAVGTPWIVSATEVTVGET